MPRHFTIILLADLRSEMLSLVVAVLVVCVRMLWVRVNELQWQLVMNERQELWGVITHSDLELSNYVPRVATDRST